MSDHQEFIEYERAKQELVKKDRLCGMIAIRMNIVFDDIENGAIARCTGRTIVIDREKNRKMLNSLESKIYILAHEALHRHFHIKDENLIHEREFIIDRYVNSKFYPYAYEIARELQVDLYIARRIPVNIIWAYPMRKEWFRREMSAQELYEDIIKDESYLELLNKQCSFEDRIELSKDRENENMQLYLF